MNSVDMATNLIFRAKHLQEFKVLGELPADFRFKGVVPFDMQITGNVVEATVWAIDFNEAVHKLHDFLEFCE
jgi:nucleoside 2-deoxyribosyltransferase